MSSGWISRANGGVPPVPAAGGRSRPVRGAAAGPKRYADSDDNNDDRRSGAGSYDGAAAPRAAGSRSPTHLALSAYTGALPSSGAGVDDGGGSDGDDVAFDDVRIGPDGEEMVACGAAGSDDDDDGATAAAHAATEHEVVARELFTACKVGGRDWGWGAHTWCT